MTTFGRKAAELIKEVALADETSLPPYNVRAPAGVREEKLTRRQEAQMRLVKAEANEHYQQLLTALGAVQGREDGEGGAAPEDAAAAMVHNQALLRNKRLMLAYVCVPGAAPQPTRADAPLPGSFLKRAGTPGCAESRRCGGPSAPRCPGS